MLQLGSSNSVGTRYLEKCALKESLCIKQTQKTPYLINIKHIRPSIPTPIPSLCRKLSLGHFNDLTRTIFIEKPNHRAGAWSAIYPYSKFICRISCRDKPKECIRRIAPRDINPTCILFLRIENGLTGTCWWYFIRDGDIPIDWGSYSSEIRNGWILSECEGQKHRKKE